MKKKKCKFCGKRYAKQEDWKTEQEKELCLKCYSWYKYVKDMKDGLNDQLKHHLGVKDKEIIISIRDKNSLKQDIKCIFCEHRLKNKLK